MKKIYQEEWQFAVWLFNGSAGCAKLDEKTLWL
jgi:hypothetical protein